jgi:AraC-like DNA-binding protein
LTELAGGLLFRLENLHRLADAAQGREGEIRRFLLYQAHQPVGLPDLAAAVHLSPSRTGRVVRELFQMPFRRLLRRERLYRARTLLLTRSCSVGEAARLAGFEDEYHFNKAFKKAFGLPPGRFRAKFRVGR